MPDETGPREEDFQALDVPVAQKIAARRAFEEERRNRILNAKKRTIGIEVDVLDEMVAARKAREAADRELEKKAGEEFLSVDSQLKMLEIERKRQHEDATKDVVDFNASCMKKVERREYYLSDPNALKKEKAPEEHEIGVSSVQRCTGEDPHFRERQKAQQAQQAQWLEQQVYAKKMTDLADKKSAAEFAQSQLEMLQLSTALEQEHMSMRNNVQKTALDYNEQKRKQKDEEREKNKFERPLEERIRDYREAQFISGDDFINETTSPFNPNGSIRRDHFRGFPKQIYHDTANMQKQMVAYKDQCEKAEKDESLAHDALAEETRRALVILEKERQAEYNETVHKEMNTNQPADIHEIRARNKPGQGTITAEFYKGYGTSMR